MKWADGRTIFFGLWLMAGTAVGARGTALEEAVFSELDGKVWVVEQNRELRPAALKSRVGGRSSVKTGDRSRAEMEFADRSLVRLGSNAVFAFRPGTREMRLDEGAMLLHVPKGLGGTTTIRTASATAAITGTTVIVSATRDGGFRMVVLEGVAEVRYHDGQRVRCRSGDMSLWQKGEPMPQAPTKVHLEGLVKSSRLMMGFRRPLVSLPRVQDAIRLQTTLISRGDMVTTGTTLDATTLSPTVDATKIDGTRTTLPADSLPTRTTLATPTLTAPSRTLNSSTLQVKPNVLQNQPRLDPRLQLDLKRPNATLTKP